MTDTTAAQHEAPASSRFHGPLALALAVAGGLVLPQFRPLLPVDETRYLTVAWEMYGPGSNLVPHLNGAIYTHKPPLLFWLIDLVWSATGPNEFAARLVGPAFGVLAVGLTWMLGRMLRPDRPETGGTAALVLATTGSVMLFASMTMFDSMLAAAVLLGVMALLRMDRGGGLWATAGLGLALALGAFAKGPVIMVHLLPLALLRPLWSFAADRGAYLRWAGRLGVALALALAVVSLWLVPAMIVGGPAYRDEVLWHQSAGRVVDAFAHGRPAWFFLAALPLLTWPWTWRWGVLRGLATGGIPRDPAGRLLAIWFLATLLLFSAISSKQLHYLVPAMPALALLLAGAAMPRPGIAPALLSLAVVGPVLAWVVMLFLGRADIGGVAVTALSYADMAAAVALAVAVPAVLAVLVRRAPVAGWALVAPLTLLFVHAALRAPLHELYDASQLNAEIAQRPEGGIAVAGYNYQGELGFVARLRQPVDEIGREAVPAWLAAHPDGLVIMSEPPDPGLAVVGRGVLNGRPVVLGRRP